MDHLNGVHIIDCSQISDRPLEEIQDTEEFLEFTHKFGNAMKLDGIVYLINTGVGDDTLANMEKKLLEFYSLPLETKKQHSRGSCDNMSWGWTGPSEIKLAHADTVEMFDFTRNPENVEDSLYPKEVERFKDAVLTFRRRTRELSTKLLRSLGEFLKLEDKDFFIRSHSALEENYVKSKFSIRSLYYPVQQDIPTNATKVRLNDHQDWGTLTHLYQNSGGGALQAKLHTGEWVDVEYIPNSFVIQAGRCLEMWSGGNIPAVWHRVDWNEKSKMESRISFACFLAPDRDACCLPLITENPNWTTIYNKMEKGETFDDFYEKQMVLLKAENAAKYRT